MVIDAIDNTVGLCEGGVWFPISEVANLLGKNERDVPEWVHANLNSWNDHLMDAIVDFAIEETARIIKSDR